MPQQERVNIAVFIDFDNIEIGVRSTLGEHFDIGTILEALKERGEVVTKIAYADWTRAGEYSRVLTQHAIRLVQRNLTPGGDKNGADINLALDALEMAFTHPHINAYVIVGGDSDFLSLVEKLKQYDKKVFVVGGRAFTSVILQRNCHEFIAYENLVRKPVARGGRPATTTATTPVAQAFPIVKRALKILADREVTPQTGLLKSTLLQLDSTFSERTFGASSFLDFVGKLAQAGLVLLKHSGRSVMVELNPAFSEDGDAPAARIDAADVKLPAEGAGIDSEVSTPADGAPQTSSPGVVRPFRPVAPPQDALPQAGDNAAGVALAGEILGAATNARWPMYLRNAKQILRAAGGFDERRYGFGGLIELLRACQREGLVRLERDRRGGLRVFQGASLARAQPQAGIAVGSPLDATHEAQGNTFEAQGAALPVDTDDMADETVEAETMAVVDTTAELLGRAKPRPGRTRAASAATGKAHSTGRGTHKTAKKVGSTPRRSSRSKRTATETATEAED